VRLRDEFRSKESAYRELDVLVQADEARLAELARGLSAGGDAVWGVSTLAGEALVARGLALRGRDLQRGLFELWRAAKRDLYGIEAVPPRKVY